ncbi:MAG: GNAT family N-acetyltransferase [Proteobacteria bacterium]|nr:GNAT family N-acetyltransferase [Pseudomonadota bacterium]
MARVTDAEAIADIYAPIVSDTAISFETEIPEPAAMAERIKATLRQYPWLVSEDSGKIVAYAYAGPHRSRPAYQWSCDVSIYVDPSAHRQGVGRSLYTGLLEILVKQGIVNAFAGITLPNEASIGLHEAMGFKPIGIYKDVGFKLGSWHDVGWWGMKIQGNNAAPFQPIPFADIYEN